MAKSALCDNTLPSKAEDWRRRPKKHFVDPDWLRRVYEVEKWQIGDIAAAIGCSIVHLNWLVEKNGIPRRDGRLGRVLPTRRAKINLDRAIWLYEVERKSCDDIGAEFGVHGTTIRRKLREAGICIRHQNDTKRGARAKNRITIDPKRVVRTYLADGQNVKTTALKFGISDRVVQRILKEEKVLKKPFGVARPTPTGPDHPSWKHDLSPQERATRRDHHRQKLWREKVFKRDGYCCQRCRDDRGRNLNAHHIVAHNEDKKLRWVLSNGITLCVPCHRGFHRRYGLNGFGRAELDEYLAAVPS